MFEIKIGGGITVTIDPALTAAINTLANALTAHGVPANSNAVVAPVQTTTPVPTAQIAPRVPVGTAAPVQPVQTVQTVQTAPPISTTAVPTSTPTYTLEQISRAGTTLIDMGKMNDLMALLARHGAQAITQIKPEEYGAVAMELRALGAQI